MNKKHWLYIILIVGLQFPAFPSVESLDRYQIKDSLQIDDSNVSPRQYDDLKDKYNGEEFIYERTLESSGWWTRFKQWLSDKIKDIFNLRNRQEAADATDIAIKTAGVILFLLVIYFIFRAILNKEGQWVFGKSSDKNIIPVTDIESNIHAVNFRSLISSAEENNNYRLAIRYYYLWLLKDLTAAELIDYDVEKTNSDYYNELISPVVKEEFSYTSYLYNYIWYGEFNVDKEQFTKAKKSFIGFLKNIKE